MNYMHHNPDAQPPSTFYPQQPSAYTPGHARGFGSFSTEGGAPAAIPHNLFAADDLMLGYDDGGDQGDPKRRRIARVCIHIWVLA
jgi:hypothetical protein